MGYSKYNEDIVDRWVDDTRDREEAFYRQWNIEHVRSPPPLPGEVHLEVEGKRLEDEEVFPTGRPLQLRAIVSSGAAPVEITIRRGGEQSTLRPHATGNYTVSAPKPESLDVDASSGAYHRRHTIHFVEVTQIDRIEGLAKEISRFTSNPPGWTREEFDLFRSRLRDVLRANSVPQSFANGLVEYFLGVQFEANGNSAFSQRLETAYTILRRFAPFSDIAALITEYFRYRTNTFPTAKDAGNQHGRPLARVTTFFTDPAAANGTTTGTKRGIELVVPEVEFCCMEAVRAIVRDDPTAALGLVSVSRKLHGRLPDPQREDRLRLIEARANVKIGDVEKARVVYQFLVTSPCSLFQDEASNFLQR